MLSGKLIRLIEEHQEEITGSVIREIRHDRDLIDMRKLPDAELRERARLVLENLGFWLAEENEADIARRYEVLGKARFEHGIPLHESARALLVMKDKIVEFVSHQGLKTFVELYAEEELDRRVGRFFDVLVVHLIRGYEAAWHTAERAA
jgi:hypothetical protein